jgi:adenosylcobinamide kinase/adenosylcobinamide-phosphate guanylyltransferase
MKTLVLGGVKSGKSRLAESIAANSGKLVSYIATAQGYDDEMRARITLHKAQRPSHWHTIEEPLYLAKAIALADKENHFILVDCLTLWITQLLCHNDSTLLQQEISSLYRLLPTLKSDIVFVSNETNMGITPMDALSRRFCDESGQLHQNLSPIMDKVILTITGLPLYIKGIPNELDNNSLKRT